MIIRDVTYLSTPNLNLEARLYIPDGECPFPCLLDVHGGAWVNGDRFNNTELDTALAEVGFLVAAVDFRQPPAFPYPAAVADVHAALRWLKTHAQDFGGDPQQVAALGASSGAQILLLVALRPFDPLYAAWSFPELGSADATVPCVVACWAISDPSARYTMAQEQAIERLVSAHQANFAPIERMEEGNPRLVVERGEAQHLPDVLILQGTADANVTVAIQQGFRDTYQAAGGSCEVAVFPGLPHSFGSDGADGMRQAVACIQPFLERYLAPTPLAGA